jgi:L-rhamnose mutarotase
MQKPLAPWTFVEIIRGNSWDEKAGITNECSHANYSLYIIKDGKVVNECAWYNREDLKPQSYQNTKTVQKMLVAWAKFQEDLEELENEYDDEKEFNVAFEKLYAAYLKKKL